MKVCLITAPIATDFRDQDEIDSCLVEPATSGPQLGVLSLAEVLERRHDDVRIFDLDQAYLRHLNSQNAAGSFVETAGRLIAEDFADVYGFSSICSSYPATIRIASVVKAARPESFILLGGPQASVVDLETLRVFPFVDFVLRGEAELSLPLLLGELEGAQELLRVPSLTYRCLANPQRNPSAPVIEDLDLIPLPAYHLVGGLHGATRAALELGRGCPFACSFCSTNDFFRRRFRLRSPDRVISDMRELAARYGIRDFELVHDMFTIDRKRVASFCDAMSASGDGFTWSCSARTDCVDEELLERMSRAGCKGIFFGVETGSPKLQKIIDKHLDLERAKQVISLTERLGIQSTVSLITGFPEETWDDLEETLEIFMFSARHARSLPQLNILAPLAGTPIHSRYRDQLTLGELSSEMSKQGAGQDAEDQRLIESYPEVFPNFYLVPTPHLDRTCLLELREFALNALAHFRWLLCAIHQTGKKILEFFVEWRLHRLRERPALSGADLRRYYRAESFRQGFLSFVASSPLAQSDLVRPFLEFEDALKRSSAHGAHEFSDSDLLSTPEHVRGTDIPVRSNAANLIELSYDIQSAIDSLKLQIEPILQRGSFFYVQTETSEPLLRFDKVSWELGRVLQVCEGLLTIQEVVDILSEEFIEMKKSLRGRIVLGLIEGARQEGLIRVYRAPTRRRKNRHANVFREGA